MIFKIGNKRIEVDDTALNPFEKAILTLIAEGKKTQRQLALSESYRGCHPKYEVDSVPKHKQFESTLRHVRAVVRNLRLNHHAPILSDAKGYFIPSCQAEIDDVLNRLEKVARAQAKSWMVTYHELKNNFDVSSDFFDSQLNLF